MDHADDLRHDKDALDIREQLERIDRMQSENVRGLAEIDKMMAETRAIKQRTFPAWLFVFGSGGGAARSPSPCSTGFAEEALP